MPSSIGASHHSIGSGELPRSPRGSWPSTSPVGPTWPRDRPRRCRLSAADCCTRATSCWRWCQCPGQKKQKNHGHLPWGFMEKNRGIIDGWLVVSTLPLWKIWVSWDEDIPNIWKVIKIMFQSTNQVDWFIKSMIIAPMFCS